LNQLKEAYDVMITDSYSKQSNKEDHYETKNYLTVLAAGFILLTGCSTPVHVQHDDSANLGNYHTYAG